ncbi:hypothetical protein B0H14DRAFT_2590637 [Mycena olivaceomarginata]|nr:hypothetical protein B0H14DRAFT_2590637 [Mycena olivaceomarginata]
MSAYHGFWSSSPEVSTNISLRGTLQRASEERKLCDIQPRAFSKRLKAHSRPGSNEIEQRIVGHGLELLERETAKAGAQDGTGAAQGGSEVREKLRVSVPVFVPRFPPNPELF